MISIMEQVNSNQDCISSTIKNKIRAHNSLKKNEILCTHCKRTSSNGIRCLGMCVADNDY